MEEFDFLYGPMLAKHSLKHTDNLRKTIQVTAMSAVEACGLSKLCIQVFKEMGTEDCFNQDALILLYHEPAKGHCSMR